MVLLALVWLPYSVFTCTTYVNIFAINYKWIHVYHVWYTMALLVACVRPIVLCFMLPPLKKAMLLTVKCKCSEPV